MRVLVCGGRDYFDKDAAFSVLDRMHAESRIHAIIHGGASGADYIAGRWAHSRGIVCDEFPADWATHGRAAGPIRNREMLAVGCPDVVVAFRGGIGTANMKKLAKAAGVAVIEPDP